MQRRLLISTLAVAVAALLLLGVPLIFALFRLQTDVVQQQLNRDTATLAQELQERYGSGLQLPDAAQVATEQPQRYVVIQERNGQGRLTTILRAGTRPGGASLTGSAVSADFKVIFYADSSVVDSGVRDGLVLLGSLASLAVGVAVVLALLQARRLSRPLTELAAAADRLGSGDARPLGRRYRLPELDRVAEGLDESAQRIGDLLAAERDFATNASHQLRTPLTALSMRLEEMIGAADFPDVVREEGAAALAQAERLTEVVSQLLSQARHSTGTPEMVSVDDLVRQQVTGLEPAYRRTGRRMRVTGDSGLRACVNPAGAGQVIAALLDNALVHGGGTVTIRTSQTARSVVIEVRDQGPGVPPGLEAEIFERTVSGRAGGTGLGLSLARTLAAASGGQVVLVRPRPAAFAAFFPRAAARGTAERAVTGPA